MKVLGVNCFLKHSVHNNKKIEDAEVPERQRAKPSKIKTRYSRPTCKNCLYLCALL